MQCPQYQSLNSSEQHMHNILNPAVIARVDRVPVILEAITRFLQDPIGLANAYDEKSGSFVMKMDDPDITREEANAIAQMLLIAGLPCFWRDVDACPHLFFPVTNSPDWTAAA